MSFHHSPSTNYFKLSALPQTLPLVSMVLGFSGGSLVKNLPVNTGDKGDMVSIPGLGSLSAGGIGKPLQ